MSTLTENVQKVVDAHAALKTSIEAKGVTVPAGTKLTGMPALVDQIQTGGTVQPTNSRAVFTSDNSSSIVVPNTMVVDMMAITNLNNCFSYCFFLTSLNLPDGFGQNATDIQSCFSFCDKLSSLVLPEGFGQNAMYSSSCFNNCYALSSLVLPEGFGQNATDIDSCFKGCYALSSLVLPERFGQSASVINSCFNHCTSLTSLTLPDGFGQYASQANSVFSECNNLQSLTLPEGFGQNATDLSYFFYYCTSLTSLNLPDGFGQNAESLESFFMGCNNLAEITGNPNFKVSLTLDGSWGLTHDSLMVVINGLQTVTETQTLTLGSMLLDKLTQEEKQVAIDKGWTLA